MGAMAGTGPAELYERVFQGSSPAAERLRVQVGRIAPHFRTALIVGEAGTGKADVARALHRLSPVGDQALLCCAADALSDIAIEHTRRGILYLHGLERLRPPAQAELLERLQSIERAMRNKAAETRVICASECDLRGMVAAGRLRGDLAARVSVLEIKVPALRERLEDLPVLLGAARVADAAMERMLGYGWPANLRELAEFVERHGGEIGSDVQVGAPAAEEWSGEPAEITLDAVLRRHVGDVLARCSGNKLRAAEMLGISRSTLYRMLDSGLV